jgi:uncharacterized protein YndB with AHSA1/START domain
MEELEPVFRALADPHRRTLLDRLRERDGANLGELVEELPNMTRFGVMKHLRVLEDAHLVTTRRAGRRKLHFLNPIPIRLLADRWISRYAAPLVERMADVKHVTERSPMPELKHVYEVYIRATPEQVWRAITESDFTRRYYYGNDVISDWQPGSELVYRDPSDGSEPIRCHVLEAVPPRRLVHTFSFPETGDPPSRVTWTIEPRGDATLLILTHDEFETATATYKSVAHGWVPILSGLKTLLETGEPLEISYPSAEGVR